MPRYPIQAVIFNPRILAMVFLGFSSGLPLALTGATLQAWYTEAGVNIVAIGALTLVGMPYVWKFLWAPIMDRFSPTRLGRRRGWIMVMQLLLCVTLFVMACFDPQASPTLLGIIALLVAFFSASQDIAIDAYRADILHPEERGLGSAVFIFAYRMAFLLSGGIALVIAAYCGWRITYQLMAGFILLSAVATYFAPSPNNVNLQTQDLYHTIVDAFGDLWQRDSIILLLLFALFYKLGDAFSVALLSNFLLHGLGFTLTQLGIVYKSAGMVGTILGAMVGGIVMIRLGLYRSLMYFGVAQSLSILTLMLLAMIGKNLLFMAVSIFIDSFCSGMGTAAFMAFLMSLCHPRFTATQYACLSALTAVGRVMLGPLAGMMVVHVGWVSFYAWAFVFCFPGLMILWLIRNRVSFNAQTVNG